MSSLKLICILINLTFKKSPESKVSGKLIMSNLSCPKCGELTKKGGYKTWQIIVAVCLFPLGLLALLADRNPTTCQKCGHTWNG